MFLRLTTYFVAVAAVFGAFSVSGQSGLTLQEALKTARTNHPGLKTEYYSIGIAQADQITAGLRPNPVLNNQTLQLMAPSHFPEHTGWGNSRNSQSWWQLTKRFQLSGQRDAKLDLAARKAVLAEKDFAETERNVFMDVADRWLNVWIAEKNLELLNLAMNNMDSLVAINQIRFRNQVITESDLSRTRLLARQYEVQHKTATLEVLNRLRELQFVLGNPEAVGIDTTMNRFPVISVSSDELLNQTQQRSDIIAARAAVEASGSNILLQKKLAHPQPELGIIWNPQNKIPYFGIYGTVELPFFSRNQGEIRKSMIMRDQAEQSLTALQSQTRTEIINAYASYDLAERNMHTYERILQQAVEILENVRYAYLRGGTTIIDFLEAQRSWLDTHQQYYQAVREYRRSQIQVLYASGSISQLAQ